MLARLAPLALLVLPVPACGDPSSTPAGSVYEKEEAAMGTRFRIRAHAPRLQQAMDGVEAAFARIHELDARLSDYQEDSEVSALARRAETIGPDEWVDVSKDLATVLAAGLHYAELSDGAFDPTLGRLTRLWRRSKRLGELPRYDRLMEARAASGWRKIELDEVGRRVRFLVPGLRLDFGGIAKGYALDEALRVLREHGVEIALVDGGGDVAVMGAPPGRPEGWKIVTEFGQRGEKVHAQLNPVFLTSGAVATSGAHYQSVTIDGIRYSHILDPRTGLGMTNIRGASLVASTGMEADALASIACVAGGGWRDLHPEFAQVGRAGFVSEVSGPPRRPNILFLLADDLGWADLGCQGSEAYRTPALDALAADGMRFTDAYAAAPNCAPTRATLMSGQPIPVHGVYTVNSGARGRAEDRTLVPPPNVTELPAEVVTLAEVLQAAGYRTGHFGKWHLGPEGSPTGPRAQGFDVNVGGTAVGHPPGYFFPYQRKDADGEVTRQLPGLEDGEDGEYLTDRLTDEAIAFLEADDGRPWFLYLPFYTVHTPIQAPTDAVAAARQRELGERQKDPTYTAMVEAMDRNCGRILDWLDENFETSNTIVIFTSDNGGYGGYRDAGVDQRDITHNHPLKGGKGMMSEGGIRVPLIVRWPGRIAPGTTSSIPVHTLDFYPTLLAAAGAPDPPHALAGRDLAPLWRNASANETVVPTPEAWPERALHWHMPGYLEARRGSWRITPCGAIRRDQWKLVEPFDDGPVELYDLSTDLGETTSLAEDHPDIRDALLAELRTWRTRHAAPMPTEGN